MRLAVGHHRHSSTCMPIGCYHPVSSVGCHSFARQLVKAKLLAHRLSLLLRSPPDTELIPKLLAFSYLSSTCAPIGWSQPIIAKLLRSQAGILMSRSPVTAFASLASRHRAPSQAPCLKTPLLYMLAAAARLQLPISSFASGLLAP